MKADSYIPALSHNWLTPLYDQLIGWTMPEATFKRHLIKQADIKSGHRVLDVGCGTATLTLLIKKTHPDADVVGVDGDAKILGIAKRKAAQANLDITLDEAMGFDLPYPTVSFDRVVSSLMFHHLTRTNKIATLREINRVLRTDGELHIADFGKAHNLLMRAASFPWQVFDGFKTTSDNVNGLLTKLIQDAGFAEVHKSADYMTLFGTLSLYVARKV
jgi:cyclopropane fatty-acyl-phospholipid synthase-like methyltransferase